MGMVVSCFFMNTVTAAPNKVSIQHDTNGYKINVDNSDVFINAITWSHKPVGVNYNYSLWNKSEPFIKKVITQDMAILKEMGATAIVSPPGIPKKWVTYIYKNIKS